MNLVFSVQDLLFSFVGIMVGISATWGFLFLRQRVIDANKDSLVAHLTHQIESLENNVGEKAQALVLLQQQLEAMRNEVQSAREENSGLLMQTRQMESLKNELNMLTRQHHSLRDDFSLAQLARTEALTRLEIQQQEFASKEQALLDSRQLFEREFHLVANRLLDEKSERITQQNRSQVGEILLPLREQLQDFRRKVEDVYDKEAKDRIALHREISLLRDLNVRISQEAENLAKALKGDNKTAGNWGELVLERVLELSGLVKGREFDVQPSFRGEDGQLLRPDVVVHLPDGKDVIIDSKVSLLHWDCYCNANDPSVAADALRSHIHSLKSHIRNLSGKQYEQLAGIRSLDFVLLFIPVEAAFLKLMEADPQVFAEAYAKGLMLVCPSTLLATLRTIQNLWRYEYQNRNALRIAECAGGLHDQFVLVVESIRELGDRLGKANQSYDSLWKRMAEGKGNVLKRVNELESLGAKARKKLVPHEDGEADDTALMTAEPIRGDATV